MSAETAGIRVAAAAASDAHARFEGRRRGKQQRRSTRDPGCGGAATHFGKNERDQNCLDFCGLAWLADGRLKGANELDNLDDPRNANILGACELVLHIRLCEEKNGVK